MIVNMSEKATEQEPHCEQRRGRTQPFWQLHLRGRLARGPR